MTRLQTMMQARSVGCAKQAIHVNWARRGSTSFAKRSTCTWITNRKSNLIGTRIRSITGCSEAIRIVKNSVVGVMRYSPPCGNERRGLRLSERSALIYERKNGSQNLQELHQ